MESHSSWRPISFVAFLFWMVFGGASFAQLQTGHLYGTVEDTEGAALPGVTLTLTGGGSTQVQVSNGQGQFRFVSLAPGTYGIKAELEGFSPFEHTNVVLNVGRNTNLEITLSPPITGTLIIYEDAVPILDASRISTGSSVVRAELEKIPTARDPWSILASVPGVLTDRINVGGNESGQQSNVVGPGGNADQSVWSVDGMVITDMAALGSSPAYYDFDSFEEMQVTTGGSDSTIATGGVVLNMVTKRGGNEWKGTGRYLSTDQDYQSSLNFDQNALGKVGPHRSDIPPGFGLPSNQTAQTSFKQGNRIVAVKDYGAELGGPVIKDRLWVWGAYGRQKVDLLTIDDVSDFTDLKTSNLKINAQLAAANSATLFGLNSDKIKLGRNAGPTRLQETTWNQSKFGPDPTAAKIEDTHILGSNFFVTGLYSKVNGGFQLVPQGGTDATAFLDGDGIWRNTFRLYQTERPQKQAKADASTFFNIGKLSHELKFGAARRDATVTSLTRWGGAGINQDAAVVGLGDNLLAVARDSGFVVQQRYDSLYLQDTLTSGSLTANLGLRYDKQTGENRARSVAASTLLPSILPALSYGGGDIGFSWADVTPRLGLTYALGQDRKTLLRASFSRFADQLGSTAASILNPLAGNSFAYFYTTNQGTPNVRSSDIVDLDGDGRIDGNDVLAYSGNVDPRTGGVLQSNGVDRDLSAQLTDEALFSVEHALLPEFVVGVNLTYRKLHNLLELNTLVFDDPNALCTSCLDSIGRRARRSDYEQVTISQRRSAVGASTSRSTPTAAGATRSPISSA